MERRCRAEVKRRTESIGFFTACLEFFSQAFLWKWKQADMRLTLKAAQVIPVWIAAHFQVFQADIFVRGRDPQRRVLNNSGDLS